MANLRAIDMLEGTKDAELGTAERVLDWFSDVDTNPDHHYISTTIEKETPDVKTGNKLRALEDFYKRIGAIGGRKGTTGGFAANRELAREAGRKGGMISRRRPKVMQLSGGPTR